MYKINHVIFAFMVLGFLYAQTMGIAMAASCVKMQDVLAVKVSAPCHDMMMDQVQKSPENDNQLNHNQTTDSQTSDCPVCMSVCLQSVMGLSETALLSSADFQAVYDADVKPTWHSVAYKRIPPPPKSLL